MDNFVLLGRVINVRGLKGELKLFSYTDFPKERFKKGNKIYLSKNENVSEFTVEKFSIVSNFIFLKLEEINDVDSANLYRDYDVLFNKKDLPKLKEGYYFSDLINLTVFIEDKEIGKIIEVSNNGANYNIRIKTSDKEILFPFVKSFIQEIDLDKGIIIYKNIGGLL